MSPHDDASIDVSDIAPVNLELETSRAHDLVGPYGAFVATMAPSELAPQAWGTQSYGDATWRSRAPRAYARSTTGGRLLDALAALPLDLWKRVALYAFLFMLFGNLLRCGGLSVGTNLACAVLVVLGLAGVLACAQRNP